MQDHKEQTEEILREIESIIKNAEVTVSELSAASGIARATIDFWLNRETVPKDINRLLKLRDTARTKKYDYEDRKAIIASHKAQHGSVPSGQFHLRLPVDLHCKLIQASRRSSMSINKLIVYVLEKKF